MQQSVKFVKIGLGIGWEKKVEQAVEDINAEGKRVVSIGPGPADAVMIIVYE